MGYHRSGSGWQIIPYLAQNVDRQEDVSDVHSLDPVHQGDLILCHLCIAHVITTKLPLIRPQSMNMQQNSYTVDRIVVVVVHLCIVLLHHFHIPPCQNGVEHNLTAADSFIKLATTSIDFPFIIITSVVCA